MRTKYCRKKFDNERCRSLVRPKKIIISHVNLKVLDKKNILMNLQLYPPSQTVCKITKKKLFLTIVGIKNGNVLSTIIPI